MAKGIRVNQLAKELGVPSKLILDKCRSEGLEDKVPNHMSVLSIGLAETVREWFSGHHGGGTAVETAPPVDVAVAKPKTRSRKKKADESAAVATDGEDSSSATGEAADSGAETAVEDEPRKTVRPSRRKATDEGADEQLAAAEATPGAEAPAEQPAAPVTAEAPAAAPEAPATAPAPAAPAIESTPTEPAPAGPASEETPMTPAIAAEAPKAAPGAPTSAPPPPAAPVTPSERPGTRPTITLANRAGGPQVERKAVPPPRMVVPAAAKIEGPRIVREEKPDVLPAPRPRRPLSGQGGDQPAFQQARPQGGRGVRVTEDDEEAEKKKAAAKKGNSLSSRRRGADGRRGEAMEKLKEYTEADLIERRDRLNAAASFRSGFDRHLDQSQRRGQHQLAKTGADRGEPIEIEEPITVKTLSSAIGVKVNDIISKLMRQGIFASINQALDTEVAQTLALEWGVELKIARQASLEDLLLEEFNARVPEEANLAPRPPVVTILGHVDHGKTSLLDKIRNANVAAGEAGGITQHTAAWTVEIDGNDGRKKRVTFIDTPGHQAFTAMRARGASMTDVVVLVVSAAEGVQPQTVESINHAKAAGVPIVVAMNKIDRPDTNEQKVLGELAANGLNPVEWGGDIEVIRTSAMTGQGIKELIEILDLQAELLELKTDPTAAGRGSVIEARVDPGKGVVATVLVQDGTLRVGDVVLCGPGYGRVRMLLNDRGDTVQEAAAGIPVIVSGLDSLPSAGDKFYVVGDLDRARSIAEERSTLSRQSQLAQMTKVTAGNLLDTIKAGDTKTIHLIVKGDAQGSVETLVKTVGGQNTDEVQVKVIHSGVGAINESDVELAMATRINPENPQQPRQVAIIGFHVVPDESARAMAEHNHIDVKLYRVIYEIFDDLKKALSGMLEPEVREKLHGHAEVRQVFKFQKRNIAGCLVTDGHIQRGSKIRLIRDGVVVAEDLALESLKRVKDDVREVKSGLECGIKLANYDDIKVGDRLEAYVRETHQRTL